MASHARSLKYLSAALLAAFCLAFSRTDTTEKSMIRAVLLEPAESGWTVGLLYQAPEASADSSEASDGIRFSAAEGATLEKALAAAEGALPQTPDFRLCDHLLLMPGSGWQTLGEYEALVLERRCGRSSALLAACDFSCAELSEATEETEKLLSGLLQAIKQNGSLSPRLYETRTGSGLLLPVLTLTESGGAAVEGSCFLSEGSRAEWDEEQASLYRLLTGQGESFCFWVDGRPLTLRRPLLTVTIDKEGTYTLQLSCQSTADSAPPSEQALLWLEEACAALIRSRWADGQDFLSLGSYAALREGEHALLDPAKNACPQLRTDVKVY